MSTLSTDTLSASARSDWVIAVAENNYISEVGHILQTQWVRTTSQGTFASATSGNGTTVSPLGISITPRSTSSLLICSWMINYEVTHDTVFLVHQDGNLITTAGYEAYNSVTGNQRYSGVMSAMYDNDNSSTPSNNYMLYAVPAATTTARTLAPAVRSAGGTAATFYLNRAISTPADNNEITVSTGVIMEIAQ